MPKMSSTDATIHAAQDLIHALQNLAPARPLVTLVNVHKEALGFLSDIFGKATSPSVPPRVPIKEAYPEKLRHMNQEENQGKKYHQVKCPITHAEASMPIDKAYPEKT